MNFSFAVYLKLRNFASYFLLHESDTNPLLPWSVPSNSTVASKSDPSWSYISATCWYFGRTLYDDVQIPLGLIDDCFGNTAIDVWFVTSKTKLPINEMLNVQV